MTNWYSPIIKANLADLLARNPDPQDVYNWVIANADQDDLFNQSKNDLADYVSEYFDPEQVYLEEDLEEWARSQGWHSPKHWSQLIKAIRSLDGLLSADFNALEPWQKEIDALYDTLESLDGRAIRRR